MEKEVEVVMEERDGKEASLEEREEKKDEKYLMFMIFLGLSFFKKSFEPAALVYSYLWDKLATKGEIRKWLGCVSYLYLQCNDNSVIMYDIHLYRRK